MAGAAFAFQHKLNFRGLNRVGLRFRIQIVFGWRKQKINTCFTELRAIGFKSAGVFVEVFVRTKLQAIHENTRHHAVRMRFGLMHQADVAGMQVTHCGHKADTAILLA